MSIENMFGDLDKIDILAEKPETKEVLMVLVCNGFIDGSPGNAEGPARQDGELSEPHPE